MLKRLWLFLLVLLFTTIGIPSYPTNTSGMVNTQQLVSTKRESSPTSTMQMKPVITLELTVTPTFINTSTPLPPTITPIPPTPTKILTVREKWILVHEQERIQRISEQGVAKTIPVLEYHGDNYGFEFSNGAVVELNPEGFRKQMQWFYENDVHAVTGEELIKWLHGEIDLPKRSVVLTFDQGYRSGASIRRMLAVFEEFDMHGIFTIWVFQMNEGESFSCINDACWQPFRDAYNSGMATIGSHTLTHRDFATVPAKEGLKELSESKRIIEANIDGCTVNILTWPFESIPLWGNQIQEAGFEAAFGGNTYPILNNAMQQEKPEDWYKLPRILPPNTNGISGRPNNKTLGDIMSLYTGQ